MIKAVFRLSGDDFTGFEVTGHAGYAESEQDIICAGVSSALMLTVNTITDFIKADADVNVDADSEGYAALTLKAPYSNQACLMIESFYEHLRILEQQYGHISVRTTK